MNPPDVNALNDPWRQLPRLEQSIDLMDCPVDLGEFIDLPAGSALTLGVLPSGDPSPAGLTTARYRDSGEQHFYPASTIKWITAALTVTWMDEHGLTPETVVAVGEDRAATLRELILSSLVLSDNDAFNTLQEAVGFAETHAALRGWGLRHGLIRRHFTRPHWNHSRPITLHLPGQPVRILPARPAVDLPLNADARPAPWAIPKPTRSPPMTLSALPRRPSRGRRGIPGASRC